MGRRMRELLAEVHHRPWTATAVACALAAFFAAMHWALPAALAAMAAGLVLMWTSEEENRVVSAMATAPTAAPAPPMVPASTPVPAFVQTAAPPVPANANAAAVPAVQEVPAVREWTNPFPAPRSARRPRLQGRRAHRQHAAVLVPSD